eukprot:scaffold2866_cov148-Isochrysis_galbana.AAC.2
MAVPFGGRLPTGMLGGGHGHPDPALNSASRRAARRKERLGPEGNRQNTSEAAPNPRAKRVGWARDYLKQEGAIIGIVRRPFIAHPQHGRREEFGRERGEVLACWQRHTLQVCRVALAGVGLNIVVAACGGGRLKEVGMGGGPVWACSLLGGVRHKDAGGEWGAHAESVLPVRGWQPPMACVVSGLGGLGGPCPVPMACVSIVDQVVWGRIEGRETGHGGSAGPVGLAQIAEPSASFHFESNATLATRPPETTSSAVTVPPSARAASARMIPGREWRGQTAATAPTGALRVGAQLLPWQRASGNSGQSCGRAGHRTQVGPSLARHRRGRNRDGRPGLRRERTGGQQPEEGPTSDCAAQVGAHSRDDLNVV